MAAMLSVVFVLYLVALACAYNFTCSDQINSNVTFQPADDYGRYIAKICTRIPADATHWSVDLTYNNGVKTCNQTHHSRNPGKMHSQLTLNILDENIKRLNCTRTNCLSTYFEMIFSSCYMIKSMFYKNEIDFPPYDTYHNIANKFKIDHFKSDPVLNVFSRETDTSIYFYGVAPSTEFAVELCQVNGTNPEILQGCHRVTDNCSKSMRDAEVRCTLARLYGCHKIFMTHTASWNTGVFRDSSTVAHKFCLDPVEDRLNGSDWTVEWVCGALVLSAGAALVLWRRRDAVALHKRVLRYWTELSQESRAAGAGAEGGAGCRHVLVVYAREGAVGQRVADALCALVRAGAGAGSGAGAGAQVHDLADAETVAAAAATGAPAEWVRALVARADCRVLVLQTPALCRLRAAPPAPAPAAPAAPAAPLLYREPQFGDSLAQYALRLLAHSDALQHDLLAYKKYYLATLSDLETEVFPQTVPFRRYALPDAAPLLLAHLTDRPLQPLHHPPDPLRHPPDAALQRLRHAVHEFVLHVRDNPDYLLDEIIYT